MSSQAQLVEALGFDPLKAPITGDIFKEVMNELQEEKAKIAKTKAKELLTKAVELHDQMTKLSREFDQKKAKFEKELGKMVRQIQSYAKGEEPREENEQSDKAAQ